MRRRRGADTTDVEQQVSESSVIPTQARGPSDEDLAVAAAASRWVRTQQVAIAGPPPDVNVAALVAQELAQQRAVEAQSAETAAYDAGKHPLGPCCYCGAESVVAVDAETGREESGWCPISSELVVCRLCHVEFFESFTWRHLGATPVELDAMRKITLAQRVLGLGTTLPWLAFTQPGRFTGLPIWWHEFAGAPPATSEAQRFRHIDPAVLRRRWDEIIANRPDEVAEPDFGEEYEQLKRRPCPRCGATGSWVRDLGPDPDWRCRHCEHRAVWADPVSLSALGDRWRSGYLARNDADAVVATLLGMDLTQPIFGADPIAGLGRAVGFRWAWEVTGGDSHGRRDVGPWQHCPVNRWRKLLDRAEAV